MSRYLRGARRAGWARAGFAGQLLTVTSQGGVDDVEELAERPIQSLNSGPAHGAGRRPPSTRRPMPRPTTAIVTDAGGTTYDVSLVRDGRIPWTRETWLGRAIRAT